MSSLTKQEWLAQRRLGIGGSDIAAIIGESKYATPLNVYLSKVDGVESIENNYMKTGTLLQDSVGKRYAEVVGRKYLSESPKKPVKNSVYAPPDALYIGKKPIYRASVDFFVDGDGVLETKTTQKDVETIEPEWFCQGQWYLGVTGRAWMEAAWLKIPHNFDYSRFCDGKWSDLDVLTTVMEFRQSGVLERNDEFIQYLQEEADKFWQDHVLKRKPPEPKNANDASILYPVAVKGKTVPLSEESHKLFLRYKELDARVKDMSKEAEELKGVLRAFIGDAQTAEYAGVPLYAFDNFKSKHLDKKAMLAAHPEVEEFMMRYTDETEGRRFRLIAK